MIGRIHSHTRLAFAVCSSNSHPSRFPFGPFNSAAQRRWKKPADTARTRLEDRTMDSKLDKLMTRLNALDDVLRVHSLMSARRRGPFVSLQRMSRWKNIIGLNIEVTRFVRKYPHVFWVFPHPKRRNLCCRVRARMHDLIEEERVAIRESELDGVMRVRKLLMMSVTGRLRVHALRLIRRDLGLPEDFRDSVLVKYGDYFRLVDLEVVELVPRDDEEFGTAKVEEWREWEYREKWLSENETRFAFPIGFPTGYRIVAGFKEKLRNWQMLPYVKPYEKVEEGERSHSRGAVARFEKRVVGILHELLSLTVEKRIAVERLAHFRRDLAFPINIQELLLKHPGIFYVSTKRGVLTVFLREAYDKGRLLNPGPVYTVRSKMLELISSGRRNTKGLSGCEESGDEVHDTGAVVAENPRGRDGEWAVPILNRLRKSKGDEL
ncbi:hypothetical protein MLD38_033225 [Melastoma candidum]|uniref:Uncharacterized protein n=1 Tax=Melastoma candidum TaxID=119954 RepID=A0ACB9M5V3_9MYRT|nr:hypothetical protein MLD38_033225 [Melastoma candidum]